MIVLPSDSPELPNSDSAPEPTAESNLPRGSYLDLLLDRFADLRKSYADDELRREVIDRALDVALRAQSDPFKIFGDYSIYVALDVDSKAADKKSPGRLRSAAAKERYEAQSFVRRIIMAHAKELLKYAEPQDRGRGGIDPVTGTFSITEDFFDRI